MFNSLPLSESAVLLIKYRIASKISTMSNTYIMSNAAEPTTTAREPFTSQTEQDFDIYVNRQGHKNRSQIGHEKRMIY